MAKVLIQPSYKPGDLVIVIGENDVYLRGGYSWTRKKDEVIGSVFEIDEVSFPYDTEFQGCVPAYTLRKSSISNVDPPQANIKSGPYHWVENWLEPYDKGSDAEDFDSIFD